MLLLARLHIVWEGLTNNGRRRLSSVGVVCNAAHTQRNSSWGGTVGQSSYVPLGRHLVTTLDTRWWRGRSIPCAGLGSSCPSAGPRSMAHVLGSSLLRPCPSRCSLMDDHPCRHCACCQSTCQEWRPGRPSGWRGSDFNVLRRWIISVWLPRKLTRCTRDNCFSEAAVFS